MGVSLARRSWWLLDFALPRESTGRIVRERFQVRSSTRTQNSVMCMYAAPERFSRFGMRSSCLRFQARLLADARMANVRLFLRRLHVIYVRENGPMDESAACAGCYLVGRGGEYSPAASSPIPGEGHCASVCHTVPGRFSLTWRAVVQRKDKRDTVKFE